MQLVLSCAAGLAGCDVWVIALVSFLLLGD